MFMENKRDNPQWKLTQVETIVLDFSGALLKALKGTVHEYYELYPSDFDGWREGKQWLDFFVVARFTELDMYNRAACVW